MYTKTSSIPFLRYGEVFFSIPEAFQHQLQRRHPMQLMQQSCAFLYKADKPVFLKTGEGMTLLVITEDLDKPFMEFVMHRTVMIHPGNHFNLLSMDGSSGIEILYPEGTKFELSFLDQPYELKRVTPRIRLRDLTAFFYNVRGHDYNFPGARQDMWELTYVDTGILETEVNGEQYELKSNQLILYAPGDHFSQKTSNHTCSYLTVMFHMDLCPEDAALLQGRVITCSSTMQKALEQFVSCSSSPWEHDILFNCLHRVILAILHQSVPGKSRTAATPMQQNFENELLNEILLYINENVYSSFNVEDLCMHFAISRSSLQQLFANNLGIAPKQFISNVKLQKARLLIKERKYNISEIANMLGYSSIHYFSRKFKQEYGITPSEYASKLVH